MAGRVEHEDLVVTGAHRRHLPGLDGLRAVAVVAVVAFHLGFLRGGFIGVDLFFVISGFLITRLLLIEVTETGRVDLLEFWRRRFRRLLPVLFVVLAATALVAKQWMTPWRLNSLRLDSLAALAYVANWRFSFAGESYFASGMGPSPLRHTWSLAIEEQFYVLWPVLLVVLLATWHRWGRPSNGITGLLRRDRIVGHLALVVVVLSAVMMVIASKRANDLSSVYYGSHTRVFALAAGSWVGTWWDRWVSGSRSRAVRHRHQSLLARSGDLALLALVVMVFLASEDAMWMYQGGFQFVALASTLVVAGACTGRGVMAGVLETAPLRWVGRRSYGIYMWSWPVQILVATRFDLSRGQLAAVVALSSLLLAWVSFALIETPLRSGRWPGSSAVRRVPGFAGLGVGAVAVAAALLAITLHAPPEPDFMRVGDDEAVAAALAPSRPRTEPRAPVGASQMPFDPADPLMLPREVPDGPVDPGRTLRIVVNGDSAAWIIGHHGAGVIPFLDVSTRAVIACGLMTTEGKGIGGNGEVFEYHERCGNQEKSDELTVTDEPDAVVLWLGAWEVYDHEYRGETFRVGTPEYATVFEGLLQKRIDRYRAAGIPTVLPLVACFGQNKGIANPIQDRPRQERWRLDWVNDRLEAVAARNRGWVHLIDPRDVLCHPDGTAIDEMPGGGLVRADGLHFDATSTAWLWRTWLGAQIVVAVE
ncbi:MAG: acyltransferase family protein [Aquihabitans sp.]